MSVRAGTVIHEKYRVDGVIGEGGMGQVFKATHLGLCIPVAIKVLSQVAAGRPDAVSRFMQEARATASIANEHIVRVFDVDLLPTGEPYIVMEALTGDDLGNLLDAYGPAEPDAAARWVLEATEGIVEAHALGIVHRDLKPSNMFLAERVGGTSTIKVLDFGISKVLVADDRMSSPHVTSTQEVLGSPGYMSPEQIRTPRDLDHRCDLWALGAILFELVTGRLPFERDTVPEILTAICMDPAPFMGTYRQGVPAALEEVVQVCLAKDRDQRYASARELRDVLAAYLGEVRVSARGGSLPDIARPSMPRPTLPSNPTLAAAAEPPASSDAMSAPPPVAVEPRSEAPVTAVDPGPYAPRRGPPRMVLVGGGAVAVLAIVALFVHRGLSSPAEPSEPASAAPPASSSAPARAPEPSASAPPPAADPPPPASSTAGRSKSKPGRDAPPPTTTAVRPKQPGSEGRTSF